MQQSVDILLLLLRNATGASLETALPDEVRWGEVCRLAAEQGVLGIAFDGLSKRLAFSGERIAGEELYYSWLGRVMLLEQEYDKHCGLVRDLSALLSENGIRMLLLKGVACSLNYPNPHHRSVGDIDIYCFEQGVEANRVFASKGIRVEEHLGHHSRLVIDGVSIENHHLLMDEDNYLSNRKFESEIQDLLSHDIVKAEIGGAEVLVPGPTLMTVHLLRHCGMDFASNTTNLRQMLDYALLVNRRSAEIDWKRVAAVVDSLGMRGFFDAMNDISVHVLGMDRSKFPAFKSDAALRGRILNDTLYSKRCHDFPDYHKKVAYGLAKTRQAWRNRWKNQLVFNEGFVPLYWQKAKNRLKN